MHDIFLIFYSIRPWSVIAALVSSSIIISAAFTLLCFIIKYDKKIMRRVFVACVVSAVVGAVLGYISGLSASPISTPLLTGVFGLISAVSVYLFGTRAIYSVVVGLSILTFSVSLVFHLLVALDSSRDAKILKYCIDVYANPETNSAVVNRLNAVCGQFFENK